MKLEVRVTLGSKGDEKCWTLAQHDVEGSSYHPSPTSSRGSQSMEEGKWTNAAWNMEDGCYANGIAGNQHQNLPVNESMNDGSEEYVSL